MSRSTIAVVLATTLALAACSTDRGAGLAVTQPSAATVPASTVPASTVPRSTVPVTGYTSAIADVEVDGPAFDDVERGITERVTAAGLPGASLLVVQHGVLVEQEAWLGYDLDTVVPIASASKWLTAATIMTLVDDGLIELDAPISTYVPELTGTVGTITMRQLLSFTSGLVDDDRLACHEDASVTLYDCAVDVVRHGVVHAPGEAFRYGSEHMLVAGAIAELVTGRSFQTLFRERIAEPLHMDHTWFTQVGDPNRPMDEVDHPMPAGSAVSTLGDYARFVEMIAHDGMAPDGRRILAADTIAEMQHDQIADARYAFAARFRMEAKTPYGLGEWLDEVDADGDAIVVSSDGAFGFRPWIDTRNDLFGVYLVDDREREGGASGPWVFDWVAAAVSSTG